MQIIIDIPDEQIEKSLAESKYIHENEGEKGFVNIAMLYTNARLEFVDVERKTDFYSCEYKILPKGHGDLIDRNDLLKHYDNTTYHNGIEERKIHFVQIGYVNDAPTIIEADRAESEK